MVALFKAELELCKIGPDQVVAVLSEGEVRADYAQAFLVAAQQIGATAFHLNLPKKAFDFRKMVGKTALGGNRPAIEALKQADLVIDLMGLLFSHEQNEITATGTRMLLVIEPFEVLSAMFPDEALRKRIEFGEQMLAKAKVMHITSSAGTDITYQLGQYPVMTEYGYTDTPGRWDHFPSGFLLTQGNDGAVNGKVVLQPGDIINAFRRYVTAPVTFTVKDGYVVDIEGEGMDGTLLRHYANSFNDPRAYAISHIGWGMNPKAKWHHMAATRSLDREIGVNGLAFYGNVLFSLGPNTELGGTNDTACHLDMPLRNASLSLDGVPVVVNGEIVIPELKAPGF